MGYLLVVFVKYILLIMLKPLFHLFFSPIFPPLPGTLISSNITPLPALSSCPWVIHVSSLASTFPILFLTSPCLFCAYHLCFFFPVPFPPFSLSPLPTDNLPCDLHFSDSVPVLVVLLVCPCFCFQVWLLITVSLLSFYCSYFLSSFSQISPFNVSYNKGLVMMSSFNLTLSEKHFICPSILNDSFTGQSTLGCRSLPFMTWNTSFQPLLACKVSFEKSADSLMDTPLQETCYFVSNSCCF